MRGIGVQVYRNDLGDCTNRGVTSPERAKGKTFVVFDEALGSGNWDLADLEGNETTIVGLRVVRRWVGAPNEYHRLEPIGEAPDGAHFMFGGNYAATSDSRFSKLWPYPLPIHDRRE